MYQNERLCSFSDIKHLYKRFVKKKEEPKKYVDKFFCGVYNTTKISKTKAKTSLMFTGIIGVFVFFYF